MRKTRASNTDPIGSLPYANVPRIAVTPKNPDTLIAEGSFELGGDQESVALEGKILFRWQPSPLVRFYGLGQDSSLILRRQRLRLDAPAQGVRNEASLDEQTPTSSGSTMYSGILQGFVRVVSSSARVNALHFHVTNFHRYDGTAVRFDGSLSRSRLKLNDFGWRVELDQHPSYDAKAIRALKQDGGFFVGHAGLAYRTSHKDISERQAREFLASLQYFLAFLRGSWCGPIVTSGLDDEKEVWTEWANWRLTPWKEVQSWFPFDSPGDVADLFRPFRRRWRDPVWKQAMRVALYWYVHANAESSSLEASILSIFNGLEILAFVYLCHEKRTVTERKFDALTATQRLETLLMSTGISCLLPSDYNALRRSAVGRRRTGPEAIARIRNALVHPTKRNRRVIALMSPMAKLDAKRLCLTYFELSFLSILQYRGRFLRRSLTGWKSDAVARVPWV